MQSPLTDLRVEILRHWRRPLYYLAAEIHVHPNQLSKMLHDHMPMPAAVRQRLLAALAEARRGR